jgi:phosphoribosylformylglycinamidine (FGAM) synthase-like enzyme
MPDVGRTLLALLASENLRSRAFVFSQYDHTVRGDTLLLPGQADAAVVRLRGRDDAIAATLDGNSRLTQLHPRNGAAMTVAEAARNLACVGAQPLAVTDGLNYADPSRPEVFWQFAEAVQGLGEACLALGTPVIGGNVSFYNETDGVLVAPAPIVGMIGHLRQAEHARGMGWRRTGDVVALLGTNKGQVSGSEYQVWLDGAPSGIGPPVDLSAEQALVDFLVRTAELGLLRSAHDVSQGGLLVALAECCLASSADFGVQIETLPAGDAVVRADALLFGEDGARAVVSFDPALGGRIAELADSLGVPFAPIGRVIPDVLRVNALVELPVARLRRAWCPADGAGDFVWPAEPAQEENRVARPR